MHATNLPTPEWQTPISLCVCPGTDYYATNLLVYTFPLSLRCIPKTNVFASARRKLRSFEGFNRKAIVIVPTDEDFKSRVDKRIKDEGRDIPDYAVLDMKGIHNMGSQYFTCVIFTLL